MDTDEVKADNTFALLGMPVLTGDDAKRFLEHDRRPLTQSEIKWLEEADEFYAEMCAKTNSS